MSSWLTCETTGTTKKSAAWLVKNYIMMHHILNGNYLQLLEKNKIHINKT